MGRFNTNRCVAAPERFAEFVNAGCLGAFCVCGATIVLRQVGGPNQGISEISDVPGPVVGGELTDRSWRKDATADFRFHPPEKVTGDGGDVAATIA
jgi:hypothetical protein